jgi:hypothetical protein
VATAIGAAAVKQPAYICTHTNIDHAQMKENLDIINELILISVS